MKEVIEAIQPTNNLVDMGYKKKKGSKLLKFLLTSGIVLGVGLVAKKIIEKVNTNKKVRVYKT